MPQPITPSTSQLGQPARTRFRARKEWQDSVQHAQADADDLRAASTSYTTTDHGADAPKPKDAPETGLPTVEVAQPLPDHPQLCILTTRLSPLSATADGTLSGRSTGSAHVEYRVYNWRRLPSGRIIRGDGAGLGSWAVLAVIGYLLWGLMRMHGGNETGGRWQISSMGGMGYVSRLIKMNSRTCAGFGSALRLAYEKRGSADSVSVPMGIDIAGHDGLIIRPSWCYLSVLPCYG